MQVRRINQTQQLTIAFLLLIVSAFALYANSFGNAWTYDDFPVIVENPDVRSLSGFLADSYPGRPLREITYLLDYRLFGYDPFGWHFQQVLWHALAGCLTLLVARRLGLNRIAGVAAGLLFLAHPLQVESVANISHRKESLALCFALLSLLSHMRACDAREGRVPWLLAALVLWGVALTGKQTVVGLPLVWLSYEWSMLAPGDRLLLRYPKLLASGAGVAAVVGVGWILYADVGSSYVAEAQRLLAYKANYFEVGLDAWIRTVLKSWGYMWSKLVWPAPLASEYAITVPDRWLDPWVIAALAGVLFYAVALWRCALARSRLLLPLLWIGVLYAPVSNVWPLTYLAADRYMYMPLAGVCLVVGDLLFRWEKPPVRATLAALCCVLLALSVMTVRQNRVWASPESLWTRAVEVSPNSSFALNNMGNVAFLAGDAGGAAKWYRRSIEANRFNPTAFYNLGMIHERRGELQEALANYRRFVALDSSDWRGAREELRRRIRTVYGEEL